MDGRHRRLDEEAVALDTADVWLCRWHAADAVTPPFPLGSGWTRTHREHPSVSPTTCRRAVSTELVRVDAPSNRPGNAPRTTPKLQRRQAYETPISLGFRTPTDSLADRVGFEPTVPCSTTVFETVPFGRSGTCPFTNVAGQRVGSQVRFAAKKALRMCEHCSFITPPSTGGL
jgi:hypothetical protein